MKRTYFIILAVVIFSVVPGLLLCRKAPSNPEYRKLDISQYHRSNNVRLRVSNYGFFGSGSAIPQYPSLEYPAGSGIDYLFQGSVWVGAKKIRRDEDGRRLFWKPDPEVHTDVVGKGTEEYYELIDEYGSLDLVVDTLTTVGFDGDASLFQLLPAYNPLEKDALGEQYAKYNLLDTVLRSIGGYPAPSDEHFPEDPDGVYDFFIPADREDDFHSVETMTSFYYDYSPFGTPGERNYGRSAAMFEHHPLELAVRQRSFTWTYVDLWDMVFFSFDIYNTGQDTLYDVALAMYMDHFIGPQSWSGDGPSLYDVSGYYAGEGYEFAYTRDTRISYEEELAPYLAATKLFPHEDWDFNCWVWSRGDGPDDRQPLRLTPRGGQITSNEKYWLMTGRNPNPWNFLHLRNPNWTPDMNPHYEEPEPYDTRFLYTMFGDMQGFYEPGINTLLLPPGESLSIHGVFFFGEDIEHLKERSLIAQEFYDSGYDLALFEGKPAVPFLYTAEFVDDSIRLEWFSSETADEQFVYYKKSEQPASQWQEINVDPAADSYQITEFEEYYIYDVKVASVFDDVFLESHTKQVLASPVSAEDDIVKQPYPETKLLTNYPNPFNPDTHIMFSLHKPDKVTLKIYNIRGQLINTLIDNEFYAQGVHQIRWDGKDAGRTEVSGGVYLYRLHTPTTTDTGRMILLK